jgi:hypothetical protein
LRGRSQVNFLSSKTGKHSQNKCFLDTGKEKENWKDRITPK